MKKIFGAIIFVVLIIFVVINLEFLKTNTRLETNDADSKSMIESLVVAGIIIDGKFYPYSDKMTIHLEINSKSFWVISNTRDKSVHFFTK